MQATARITAKQKARFLDRIVQLINLVVGSMIPFNEIMQLLDEVIRKYQPMAAEEATRRHAASQVRTRDMAEERRAEMEKFYRDRGFTFAVPKPSFSNREFSRRAKLGWRIFFRPATMDMTYEQFMAAVGQGGHWTVMDQNLRAEIGWDVAAVGYWFWAEVSENCPRLKTSWNDLLTNLTGKQRLFALEEYVIVWHMFKDEIGGRMLDASTRCWLRTRFGQGALCAHGYDGRVGVDRYGPDGLARPFDYVGGRAAEVEG